RRPAGGGPEPGGRPAGRLRLRAAADRPARNRGGARRVLPADPRRRGNPRAPAGLGGNARPRAGPALPPPALAPGTAPSPPAGVTRRIASVRRPRHAPAEKMLREPSQKPADLSHYGDQAR